LAALFYSFQIAEYPFFVKLRFAEAFCEERFCEASLNGITDLPRAATRALTNHRRSALAW
jgi:hypothetical protein